MKKWFPLCTLLALTTTEVRSLGSKIQSSWCALLVLLGTAPGVMAQAAGSDLPMRRVADMFKPLSRPAEMIHDVSVLTFWICGIIFAIVAGLLVYIIVRFGHYDKSDHHEPPQIYGSKSIELAWTVIPIIITVVLILVTSRTIGEIQNQKMPADALKIRVVGHQWWWEIHYPDLGIVTANEVHIPVSNKNPSPDKPDRPTHLDLQSADVIHSFWVPQLAGKTDMVPNRTNELWLDPYETGVYFGNCAEYCGTQHAHMLIRVVVDTPENFQKWVASQKAAVPAPQTASQIEGQRLFFANSCINCHTVAGTLAQGVFAPDLTKLMTRQTIGAGVAPLTKENLLAWIRDPQKMKVGCLMPDMQMQDKEVTAITDYLETLK